MAVPSQYGGEALSWEDLMHVEYVKRFIEERKGYRIEGVRNLDGGVELTAVDAEGALISVRLIGSRVPLSEINTEVTHEAHEGTATAASYVYLAIPSRKLIYITRRTRQILAEKSVGVLEVRTEGDVIEVIPPKKREVKAFAPTTQPVVKPARPESLRLAKPEPAPTAGPETGGEGLPDFVRNNPWLSVLGRRRAGGG